MVVRYNCECLLKTSDETSGSDVGWSVFGITYVVDQHITIIQIKLAKSLLHDVWKDQMRGNHVVAGFPNIHPMFECYSMFNPAQRCQDRAVLIDSHSQT